MSQENVEIVTALYQGAEAMNKEQLLATLPDLIRQVCDPEIEWIEDPKRADSRIYRGHDGVLASFERWLEGFDEYGTKLERIVDCGDRVFVASREEGKGAISGATVDVATYQVITFQEGKVLHYQEFSEEAEALEAAGLQE